ncbi:hypothetical protein KY290_007669 [Solanum tuberosum]|uniref:Uncharacterized protein n=1 Tax=Solanum tuberosum TaxID=4113 RepID=A0ABQ7W676_SOLTU|nr:hypothetical protein KY290_007669 [Solanum tuberosum]
MSKMAMILSINRQLVWFAKLRYPWMVDIPSSRAELIRYLEEYSSKFVLWKAPNRNCFKCNTDGASRGNPRPTSLDFRIKNWEVDAGVWFRVLFI